MATLYISAFGGVSKGVAVDPCGAATITTSGVSAQSSAIAGDLVKVQGDAAHYIAHGSNPTAAAASGTYVASGEVFWLKIRNGDKLAAITA